ncbi:MAG TPA: DedA family protein [Prolixibacteraceae bacterium]|nr:DedA family protein [Prolixibacteraceae bacterium]
MMEYFQTLADWYMSHMNYLTIVMLMAIESSFVPLPSEIVIPPAIWHALKTGDLNIYLVVVFATIGAAIGALFNYVMARWLGRVIVYGFAESKVGKLFFLNQAKIEHAEAYFNRHGRSSTFIGRLIPGIRHLISIPAGLAKMDVKQFVLYTALGSAIWHTLLAALSYYLYSQQDLLMKYMHELSYLLLGMGAMFVVYLVWKYKRKKE